MARSRSGEGESFAVLGPPGVKPVVNSIFDFSAEALAELRLWLEQNPPAIGISNILGFSQFTAQTAAVTAAGDTTVSTTYVDLATVGPTLSALPDGNYVFVVKSNMKNDTAGQLSLASILINATTPVDAAAAASGVVTGLTSCVGVSIAKLANGGSNTVKVQGRVTGGTGTFGDRTLLALKYANK